MAGRPCDPTVRDPSYVGLRLYMRYMHMHMRILKLWHHITNPTELVDAYSLEE